MFQNGYKNVYLVSILITNKMMLTLSIVDIEMVNVISRRKKMPNKVMKYT